MRHANKVDLGEIQIHKKVIGDIAAAAIKSISGVRLSRFGFAGAVCDLLGYTNYPGVMVKLDKNGTVSLDLHIVIDYGMNIPLIANQVQDVVHKAVLEAVDIELYDINVNVQAVLAKN